MNQTQTQPTTSDIIRYTDANHVDNVEYLEAVRLANSAPDLLAALRDLAEFCTSGRRYETQNPYTVAEIKAALDAISAATGEPRWNEA